MEFQSRHKKIIPALAMLIVCFIALNTFAQDDTKTRSITSDDFASQRPKSQNAEFSKKLNAANDKALTGVSCRIGIRENTSLK